MRKPQGLKKGDKVAFVSTARKCSLKEIDFALKTVESWGLEVVIGKSIGPESNQFAGNDELRIADLQHFLDDEQIKAIFCAKGGYGTVRLIDSLDFHRFIQNPKWIVGYSDVTVLHAHIQQNFSIQSLHAPLLFQFEQNSRASLMQMRDCLFGEKLRLEWESTIRNKIGQASGVLIGGNLSVLYSLSGSLSDLNTDGKILFLEDLDEYLYHVDRMLMQFERAGKFKNLAGFLIGGMTEMRDNAVPFGETTDAMISRICKDVAFPIAFNCPAGHVDDNFSLPLGETVHLTCSEDSVKLTSK